MLIFFWWVYCVIGYKVWKMKKTISLPARSSLKTISIFPTFLHVRSCVFGQSHFDIIKNCSLSDKESVSDKALGVKFLELATEALYAEHVNFDCYDTIEISEMWMNVLEPGGHHWFHHHANHIMSGVFYLTENCHTIFIDPRPAASVLSLNYKKDLPGGLRSYVHNGAPNSLVLFPSWLGHRVAPTSTLRKTIAFNVMIRGQFGGAHSKEQIRL